MAGVLAATVGGGVILVLAALLGLVLGSFVTMLSSRLPIGGDVFGGRSLCPKCGAKLAPRDLVPLLSWLVQRGRCRYCTGRISPRYPATELVMAAAAVAVAWRFGATTAGVVVLLLAVALLTMAVVDLEYGILPDVLQLAAGLLGLVMLVLAGTWTQGAIGAAVGLAVGLALRYGFYALRGRHGLGLGDVKFFAVAGLWLGVAGLMPFFALAGIVGIWFGLMWRRFGGGAEFPFGPALCLSLFLLVLFPIRL